MKDRNGTVSLCTAYAQKRNDVVKFLILVVICMRKLRNIFYLNSIFNLPLFFH